VTGADAPLFCEPWQGKNERVAPMRVVESSSEKITFNLKEALRRCSTICFPTIPPFGAQERDIQALDDSH
jgi:hypothetical protein